MEDRISIRSESAQQENANASPTPPVQTLPATDYPRKRASIACEICRLRRTRCEGQKPSCSKCQELRVKCTYRQPGLWDRVPSSTANAALTKFDERLDRMDQRLAKLSEQFDRINQTLSGLSDRLNQFAPLLASSDTQNRHRHSSDVTYAKSDHSDSLHPNSHSPSYRMPNLLTFTAPPAAGPFTYSSSQQFFKGEIHRAHELFYNVENASVSLLDVDLSPQRCARLQRVFIDSFLRWMPIFDDDTCFRHTQIAALEQYAGTSPSVGLSLLIFAIGATAEDQIFHHKNLNGSAGYPYMVLAHRCLDQMRWSSQETLHLQCRILLSVYMSFAMRPILAWNSISQVSAILVLRLKTDWRGEDDETAVDAMERMYWAVYVIENELEICLELKAGRMHSFDEHLALPTSPYDEEGLYYFLALASHRKLLVDVTNTIGYRGKPTGTTHYLPILAQELCKQLDNWYDHLPATVKFPLNASPLFDLRKVYLRSQYYALIIFISWPSVVRYMEIAASSSQNYSQINDEMSDISEKVKKCLDCCVIYLKASEALLMQKTLVTHLILRGTYAFTVILILFRRPVFRHLNLPDPADTIRHSLGNLNIWRDVPFMKVPLEVIFKFAQDITAPIPVQNEVDDADQRPIQRDDRGLEGSGATAEALRSVMYPPMGVDYQHRQDW